MNLDENFKQPVPFERLPTGISGLDRILRGGLLKGGVYLMLGPPGSGKTILANQICFNHARTQSASVVYVTLLAESHSRMMGNLRTLRFFRDSLIAHSVHYISGYRALEKEGLKGLLFLIAQIVREKKATLLLIDGISTIGELDQTALAFRKFVHELNTFIATAGCTAVLLSSMEGHLSHPEHTMVDGIVSLHFKTVGLRSVRQIEVRKFRGSDHAYGKHFFKIFPEGIRVFPRVESNALSFAQEPVERKREKFNIPTLDQMLGGGLFSQSVTGLLGSAGTGKTILGMKFLTEGAVQGDQCLYFGLYETQFELFEKSDRLNLGFREWVEKGKIEVLWYPALEQELDELGKVITDAIQNKNVRRLFIDGMDGLRSSASFPKRLNRFVTALFREIKALGATVVFTEETSLFHIDSQKRVGELSALNDNILFFQHINVESRLCQVLTVIKMRSSDFDPTTRQIEIVKGGILVSNPIEGSILFSTEEKKLMKAKLNLPKSKEKAVPQRVNAARHASRRK